MDNTFDPEKYGMLFCLECNGNGKLLNDPENIEVCPKCGGFGFIKKEKESDKERVVNPSLMMSKNHGFGPPAFGNLKCFNKAQFIRLS